VAAGLRLRVDGRCTAVPVVRATAFRDRAIGLLGRPARTGMLALQIRPCAAVHTFGMRRAIDVVFVDSLGRVLRVFAPLLPWRVAWARGASAAWELPAGTAAALGIAMGSQLQAAAPGRSTPRGAAPAQGRFLDAAGARDP
jgi:uncharacterized membrane protein (UPF0127 family)